MKTKPEWRAFVVAAVFASLGLLIFIIAVSTNYWLVIDMPLDERTVNSTSDFVTLSQKVGLWEICTTNVYTASKKTETTCQNINLFPSDEEKEDIGGILLDYRRSETAMLIIAISLMVLGEIFMVYAFKQNKYMITRLAGIIFLLAVVAILACIQLFQAAKRPVLQSVQQKIGGGVVNSSYSWSFGFGWISFTLVLAAGAVFLFLSRKRKKRHGVPYVEEDDEDLDSAPMDDI